MPINNLLADAARKGAELDACHGKMCHDCAFRVQPDVNGYMDAVNSAMDLLVHNSNNASFHCHTPEYGDAGKLCSGFLYAKQYFDYMERKLEKEDRELETHIS